MNEYIKIKFILKKKNYKFRLKQNEIKCIPFTSSNLNIDKAVLKNVISIF